METIPNRKNKNKAGRPRKPVDTEALEKLAALQCTLAEMSSFMKVSVDTLERHYAEIIKRGQETGRVSLRRWQFVAAQKGNVAMMIWLGKQFLGQRDKSDVEMQGGVSIVWDKELDGI